MIINIIMDVEKLNHLKFDTSVNQRSHCVWQHLVIEIHQIGHNKCIFVGRLQRKNRLNFSYIQCLQTTLIIFFYINDIVTVTTSFQK